MKYIIIPIIALGFTLCSLFGVEYTCLGHELFPHYYGSPFIYMRNNLGSSLEYYYSITGLFFDVITWSLLLLGLHFGIDRLIKWTPNQKLARVFYYSFTDVFVFFAALNMYMAATTIGSGFEVRRLKSAVYRVCFKKVGVVDAFVDVAVTSGMRNEVEGGDGAN